MNKELLKQILAMNLEENQTFKLSETMFLFVDNWGDFQDKFTSLELNSGYEEDGYYILEDILECGTYNFKNEEDIKRGIEYMVLCSKDYD